MYLKKFVAGDGRQYVFPPMMAVNDNFGHTVPRTRSQAGLDGGFDEYGDEPAPAPVGSISSNWVLLPGDFYAKNMRQMRDAVEEMGSYGKGVLWAQAEDSEDARFCYARLNAPVMPKNVQEVPHRRQAVAVTWQADLPRWLSRPNTLYFDDGHFFDTGLVFGADRLNRYIKNGDVFTLTNNGTAFAAIQIVISTIGAAANYDDPGLTYDMPGLNYDGFGNAAQVNPGIRFVDRRGRLRDEWTYRATLPTNSELRVESMNRSMVIAGADGDYSAYPDMEVTAGTGFIRIPPGASQLEYFSESSGYATMRIEYFDTWA